MESLEEIGQMGNNGYVVNSIPLAIAAANKIHEIGLKEMYSKLIQIGGDTDTNCSLAGQIAGTLVGFRGIPNDLLGKLRELNEYYWIETKIDKLIRRKGW